MLTRWLTRLRQTWHSKKPPLVCPAVRFSRRTKSPQDWQRVFEQLDIPPPGPASISIITPLWNTKPRWLAEAAISVFDQTTPGWEWCIIDDGSTSRDFEPVLGAIQQASPRVRVQRLERNSGIAAASNAGLQLAQGEFVCFLDHDDLLHPEAIEHCRARLKDCEAVYTDSDKAGEDGVRDEPFLKPDWSPEYFRGVMYVGHLLCVRREEALSIGGFDTRFDGVQDFEFFLRYSERFTRIAHIPRILYHWRRVPGSIAGAIDAKDNITTLQQQAVQNQLDRLRLNADAIEGPGAHRITVVPKPRITQPSVSIIATGENVPLNYCGASFSWRGASTPPVQDTPDFLLFLNPDIEPVTPDWIDQLLYHAEQPDAGAVGALILNPDQSVHHAGIALGGPQVVTNITTEQSPGSLTHAHECTAVSKACLMIRRQLFEEVGGFNQHYFHSHFDVDLCLRLRALGKRNVFTPRAVLIAKSTQQDDPIDRNLLLDNWEETITAGDPFHRAVHPSVTGPQV